MHTFLEIQSLYKKRQAIWRWFQKIPHVVETIIFTYLYFMDFLVYTKHSIVELYFKLL